MHGHARAGLGNELLRRRLDQSSVRGRVCTVTGEDCCPGGACSDDNCDRTVFSNNVCGGFADNGGTHMDSAFLNAYIGLRIGHYAFQDSELAVRRCSFNDNFAGVSVEDFNALNIWLWDSEFRSNYVAATNNVGRVRATFDPGYHGGECDLPAGAPCWDESDCDPGGACSLLAGWAGDLDVIAGRFEKQHVRRRDRVSHRGLRRSGQRFRWQWTILPHRGSQWSAVTHVAYQQPVEHTTDNGVPLLELNTLGTFLLVDNLFLSPDVPTPPPPALLNTLTGALIKIDVISIANTFTVSTAVLNDTDPNNDDQGPYDFLRPFRLRSTGDSTIAHPGPLTIPPGPTVADPLDDAPVYTITGAATATRQSDPLPRTRPASQSIIDAAAAEPAGAIVHFPSDLGRYLIDDTCRFRPGPIWFWLATGSGLGSSGSGRPGFLPWSIDADQVENVTLRDLQLFLGGAAIRDLPETESRLFLSQLRVADADHRRVVPRPSGSDRRGKCRSDDLGERHYDAGYRHTGTGRSRPGAVARDGRESPSGPAWPRRTTLISTCGTTRPRSRC